MFEVIITDRRDYSEHVLGYCETREQAEAAATSAALEYWRWIVRAWVRKVRGSTSVSRKADERQQEQP